MRPIANLIGKNVAKYRYQRGWTQDELVGKLQLAGCDMSRDILANIETQRRIATDIQLRCFARVFRVATDDLYSGNPTSRS